MGHDKRDNEEGLMSIEVFWRLPVHGDGRTRCAEQWHRGDYSPHRKSPHPFARTGVQRDGYTYYDHLSQIAGAADLARFDGLWIPQSAAGEEPLIVAGAFAREARHLKFVPALRAPLLSAVYATKIANSFQRLSGGRLAWYLVTEEDPENAWHGRRWSLQEQIERTGEFLDVARGFWNSPPFTYRGKYYEVENGGFPPALQGATMPVVYLSGESDQAYALSARHADVHVLPLLPIPELRQRIDRVSALAAQHGRKVRFAVEADLVARHTDEEAWSHLRGEWESLNAKAVSLDSSPLRKPARFDEWVGGAYLWSGFGQFRPGASAGFVGSYETVAGAVEEYVAAGVSGFVFSANPHLEEAYRIGEKLLPRIRALAAARAA